MTDMVIGGNGGRVFLALHQVLARVEKAYIKRVLDEVRGNQTRAAEILGIARPTLCGKLKKHGITVAHSKRRSARRLPIAS